MGHGKINRGGVSFEPLETRAMLSSSLGHFSSSAGTEFSASHFAGKEEESPIVANLGSITPVKTSTIPANGDLNPYGTAFVPEGFAPGGPLHEGDLLVSNFNNGQPNNLQGTGTTIVRITPDGKQSVFFQGAQGLGLTTGLGVLKKGFVIVGNLPTLDGTGATAQPGSLIVLDKNGNQVASFTDSSLLGGPWDLAINDEGSSANVFVSNVLTGTVSRLDLKVTSSGVTLQSITQIASGYTHRTDPLALLLGPTGLAFDEHSNKLYVASTADNAIFSISNAEKRASDAGEGKLVYKDVAHLHGPLGLVLTSDGNLIAANGDAVNTDATHTSELTEFTKSGHFLSQFSIDPAIDAAFGIAIQSDEGHIRFAAVNDNNNTVSIWTLSDHGDDKVI
ncbi:MAG: hypothetical protein M3O30_05265 [Planctomycetota bacterium]|nr:hypothetical protein [Planctomycetota bacterium]